MGSVSHLEVIFHGDVTVFSPGDTIRGEVVLSVEGHGGQGLRDVKGQSGQCLAKITTQLSMF